MKNRPVSRHLTIGQTLSIERSGGLVGVSALHEAMLDSGIPSKLVYTESADPISDPPEAIKLQAAWGNRFYFGWKSAPRIEKAIRDADIVHVHGLYTYMNYLAGLLCRRYGKALVYHPHGFLVPAYLASGRIKKGIVLRSFERRNIRYLTAWRALTTAEARQVRDFAPGANVFVVPNGISLPEDISTATGINAQLSLTANPAKRIFLSISRVRAAKGLDLLLEAWVAAGRTMRNCELWIVGPDSDGTGRLLRKRIRDQQLDNVRLVGAVSEQDKSWLFRAASVFVLTSWGEGQSATILEAMAHAKPTLLTDMCYFPEATLAGAGYECSVNVAKIKELLVRFAEMPNPVLDEMGTRAQELISEQFDIRHVARELDRKTTEILRQQPERETSDRS